MARKSKPTTPFAIGYQSALDDLSFTVALSGIRAGIEFAITVSRDPETARSLRTALESSKMPDDVYLTSVNEDNVVYDSHRSLDSAIEMLREFPNDRVIVTVGWQPTTDDLES